MSTPLTAEPVLELIFAIFLPALSAAILFNIGASGGGTDIIAMILKKYTSRYHLNGVKTVNLGTMYLLNYEITLKDVDAEKQMIDELRCRNGNLTISSVLKADEMSDL